MARALHGTVFQSHMLCLCTLRLKSSQYHYGHGLRLFIVWNTLGSSRIGWNSKFARDFYELGCVALVNTVFSILVNFTIPYMLICVY